MLSLDTNLFVYAANAASPQYSPAQQFISSLIDRDDVVICELVLVEVYLKIRSPLILPTPFSGREAADFCQEFRQNPKWRLVESAPVMQNVWEIAGGRGFAFRRIIDARLALTLRHYNVTEFATANTKDFDGFGFTRVWNPLAR